ncbi:polyprenyl synthetase family protein [Marinilabiliaceae bacterium ANBcel2]|nr:polyprenyl synthetase family protein [Marinilabiliaceae bacterium ANBcel2]
MSLIEKYREKIAKQIDDFIICERNPRGLYEPVEYVLSLGGKRIRPALCLAAADMFNGSDLKTVFPVALGIEVFHNFTLLHDDIMDGADLRRNSETVHKKWDSNTAILSGDVMLIKAYQLISRAPETVLKPVLDLFNSTAVEVCEGQQFDMEFENRETVSVDEYINMIRLKTGVLIGCSLKAGAIVGGASTINADLLYQFGVNIGIAFQLQDDILDVYGDSDLFGKNIGGDIVSNKKTMLLIHALATLKGDKREALLYWMNSRNFKSEEKIENVRNLYNLANVLEDTQKLKNYFFEKALGFLHRLDVKSNIKDELSNYAKELMSRSK